MTEPHAQLIAGNVRGLREDRRISLGELARRSGLSKQTLSTIEQGLGNPRVDSLSAIADAFGVPLRRLLSEPARLTFVSRASAAQWEHLGGRDERSIDQIYGTGFVRTQLLRCRRGAAGAGAPVAGHAAGTLHHLFVVDGCLEVGPVSETSELEAGDFMRFAGDVAHVYRCRSPSASIYLTTTLPLTNGAPGAAPPP